MVKVFIGEDGSAFAGVQLAGSDYESASSTYAGTAKTALSYAQSANFLSHVLIDDEQLAKPGEAFLNVWGKKGYFTFRPGNNSATKITILAGCQFPTYIALETGAKEAYVTTEDITFVKEGENWVQQVETEFNLEAYKTKKIAELQAYKQGEVESEEERLSLVSKATTSISRATDKERVDTVVASIKVKIDELPAKPDDSEILNPLKDDAKAQLDAYLADGDYSGLQVIDRNSAITKGKVLIENAGNEQAVIDALAQAKALVDSALNREVNYVDVTAVIKVTNEHKPNGNFNVYVVFAGVDAVAGDHTYDVKIGDVLSALGFWDNVVVAGKTLTEWGVTGGWNEDNVIGYNVGEPLNNVRILCHSEDWKTSDVEFASSIVSNYEMTIKEGTLIPSQAYFTGADTYDVYRVQLEMNSVDEAIAYSFKGYAETDVVSVKLAEESEVTHLALDFSNDDFPTEGGAVDFPDWYFGDEYNLNGYWVKVKVNGGNGIGKLAKFNLNEGGRGAFAIEVDMPYDQISSITIPAGTIFPTYAFLNLPALNNDNKLVVVLKTAKDVTFVKLEDGSWISVDAYRADALATLADAKAGYAEENYFEADFEALVEAYESGVELINNATTIEDIDSALEQAIALLEVVPTKAVVIEAAKEEISAYKEGLFREAEEAQRLAIVAEAQATFDTCGSEEAVANALADAKAEVDALKTAAEYADEELAEVKAEAREQIANYLDKANYYADEQAEIDRAIEAGHDLVAQATNEVEIAQAVVDAKALLDAIYTQEEVRENVKADLSAYKAEDVFRVEEQAQRDAIVEKALADLEGLTDLAEINSIVEKAYEDIDALTTNDEYIEAELALLKADAKAEIEAYLADRDYIPSQERYRAEAIEDAMKALEKAKSEDAINQVVEEAKANLDGIAKMATIVDTAMMVRITDINHAGGNLNMFIIIPGLDVGTAGDGLSFDYSKESLEALFDEFGLYDMIYINDKSLRDWGFVGFWNGSLGFNVDGPSPHIYLHMHTDNPEYAAAVESGEITFTKYKDTDGDGIGDTLDIKQSAVSVDKGLLIPGYAFLSEEENAVVYRLSTDVVTRGEHRPYDLETRAYTNVDSVAYVQEDIIDDEFKGGYFGISLEGDDFPAFEGDHSIVLEGMRNYANYDRILINGEAGHVDKYALFNRGENGKGRISIAIDVSSEDMKSITIPAGTTFPAYSPVLLQPHNNNNIIFIYFETTTDVTFIKLDNGEWIKFEDYVQSAKDAIGELKAEKEALDCFAADMTLIANTYADAMTALDNATEAEEVKATLANALEVLGAIQSKVDVIANAKAELDAYKADSFLEAEDAQRAEAVADAKTAIETANSSAEVANIVASTKEFIDTLKTANEYAKEAIAEEVAEAKAELDAYKAEDGLYREEEVAARLAIIEDAKLALDEALDLDTVAEIVANAKADIDELKTDAELSEEERLAGVKEDAIKAINAKKASIDLTLYSEDAVLTISTLYNEAKLAIESATSDDEIADIVAQFSEDVDAVPQLGEEPESSESESSQESTSEAITGGCLGNIGGLSSVFALLSVMAVAVVIKKRR
ncbi:MAG: hypothetical protein IKA99_02390 [Clostridia bacterium]|nr:hypothetical protein [Clostridia bacterium]